MVSSKAVIKMKMKIYSSTLLVFQLPIIKARESLDLFWDGSSCGENNISPMKGALGCYQSPFLGTHPSHLRAGLTTLLRSKSMKENNYVGRNHKKLSN
jgi:hypothetical protein